MTQDPRMDRSHVNISSLREQGADALITDATPAELVAMVWPLTLEVWALKEPDIAERQFQRHVVRVVRGQR